jgi:LuxR family maltose regulon positive regulatory protein
MVDMAVDGASGDGTPPRGTSGGPAAASGIITRRRLDHRYAAATGGLIRVLGPSGYGKTTLVAQWTAGEERPLRWLDVQHRDDDPVALFQSLRNLLDGIADIRQPSAAEAAADEPYVRALTQALVAASRQPPYVLVVDDVHRIRSQAGCWMLRAVVEHMPPGSTVVFLGRGHHEHGTLGHLRLSPGVVDVTVDDLAFEQSESYQLLDSMGVDTSSPRVARVVDELEGWPAGVRLAGRVLLSNPDLVRTADHVSLVDYLRDEWTERLDHDDLAFLRELACLREANGTTCDSVLGRTDSAALLRRLHRESVVVFALDQRDDRYRMHGLLARWLEDELHRADPDRWTEIHLRSATWCEQTGDIDAAVAHLMATGDADRVEALVAIHGAAYFTRGLEATVERWLSWFSPTHLAASPALTGLQAIKALHRGDDALGVRWMAALDRVASDPERPGAEPTSWCPIILHAALDEKPAADSIPGLVKARRNLNRGPWSVLGCWVEGALNFLIGDLDRAREVLDVGAFDARLLDNPLAASHCLSTRSILEDFELDAAAAEHFDQRAQELVIACGGELLAPAAISMASAALQCARRGEDGIANMRLRAARLGLDGFRSTAPWFNVIARIALVRAALILDERETATVLLEELEQHARIEASDVSPRPDSALAHARSLRLQVEAMHVPATGASALTGAERRVLRLLPTNLSLGDIAGQLYISRNTVKSHAAAIYRKLGASTRSDAVALARDAGLLDGS